jgi:hypothetical protein
MDHHATITVMGCSKDPSVWWSDFWGALQLVSELKTFSLTDATLYIGYPILSTADQSISLDAILTCVEHGIVVFDLGTYLPDSDWSQIEDITSANKILTDQWAAAYAAQGWRK